MDPLGLDWYSYHDRKFLVYVQGYHGQSFVQNGIVFRWEGVDVYYTDVFGRKWYGDENGKRWLTLPEVDVVEEDRSRRDYFNLWAGYISNRKGDDFVSESAASGGGFSKSALPSIDKVTAPWSREFIIEKAFQILTDQRMGIAADFADELGYTKGIGNAFTLMSVASDSYQRFYAQSIDDITYGYRLTTTGLAAWVGYSTGPIGGISVGLYSTGIEKTARTGAKLEIQLRNYFNPTTKNGFWSQFYW